MSHSLQQALVSGGSLVPALGLRTGDAAGLKALARSIMHEPDAAILAAQLAIEVAPKDAEAHLLHGLALARAKYAQRASDALRASLQIDSASIVAWASLGEVLLDAFDYKGAKEAFEHVMRLDPQASDPYGRRARVVVAKTLQRLKKAARGRES
jgi:cytochrome c-type biogenesis protein CcmH/NrfG